MQEFAKFDTGRRHIWNLFVRTYYYHCCTWMPFGQLVQYSSEASTNGQAYHALRTAKMIFVRVNAQRWVKQVDLRAFMAEQQLFAHH